MAFAIKTYLLPPALIGTIGEGLGLATWKTWDIGIHQVMHFTLGEAVVFEMMRLALALMVVAVCAYIIWILGEAFCNYYHYRKALMLVIYSFGPLLLIRPLNSVPWGNLWFPWVIGIFFSLKIFYYGIPRMLNPAPGSALGLYFVSASVITGLTSAQHYLLIRCLTGHGISLNNLIFDMAGKLPF